MRKILTLCAAAMIAISTMAAEGALNGKFSVSATKQVVFSQGNLQYQASTDTWRFAENQWDTIGAVGNAQIAADYAGWIDLFGWGTGNNPTEVSETDTDYSAFTDWGSNKISNGGNVEDTWFTMSTDEWVYLFVKRTNANTLFALGTVNSVNGVIILPDNWTLPAGASFTPTSTTEGMEYIPSWDGMDYYYDSYLNNHFSDNAYTAYEWEVMQANGAVFLPAAGHRDGTYISGGFMADGAYYWSATPTEGSDDDAGQFTFSYRGLTPIIAYGRHNGLCVRLVQTYSGATAINNTAVDAKAVKRVVNGQLLIEREGKTFNAQGIEVK